MLSMSCGAAAPPKSAFAVVFELLGGHGLSCCTSTDTAAVASEDLVVPITACRGVHIDEMVQASTPSTRAATPVGESEIDEAMPALPMLLGSARQSKPAECFADGFALVAASPAADRTPASLETLSSEEAQPALLHSAGLSGAECFVRTPSFEQDCGELPELRVPRGEQPMCSGHLSVPLSSLAEAIFADETNMFTRFLTGELGCWDMKSSPCVEDERGAENAIVQRSIYQLPPPADVPDRLAHLLGVGNSVTSATTTRASMDETRILVQQSTRTEGLLYSERMRLVSTHCLEVDPKGGVAWHSYMRIVWTKPLPWTHAFLAKIIDSRVKAEMRINVPQMMQHLQGAVEAAGSF